MGVDHGGGDIRMSQEFLHRADVVACFEQMGGKGMAQGMAARLLIDTGPQGRIFHGFLDQAFMGVVPPHLPAAGILRQAFQKTLRLLNLPLLDSWTIPKIFKKRTDIFGRTIPHFFPRHKVNKTLRPFGIEGGKVRPYPVLLKASLKSVLKSLNRHRLVCVFFSHKTSQPQLIIAFSAHGNRQNKYITRHGRLPTC
jgi:hypothetical protein